MISMTKSKLMDAQIKTLVRGTFGDSAALLSVTELGGGMFSTAYELTLGYRPADVPDTLVLKASVAPGAELLSCEKHAIQAEVDVIQRLKTAGVPVPEIVRADFSRRLLDRDFFFMTKLPGVTWFEVNTALPYGDKCRLKEQLGAYTAAIHSVKNDGFGYPCSEKMSDSWRDAFSGMLEALLLDAKKCRLRLPYKELRNAVGAKLGLLDEITRPCLVDFDLWAGNILLTETRDGYDITGIVDFERAFYGDPYADFVSSMMIYDDVTREDAFLDGYATKSGSRPVFGDDDRCRMLIYRIYQTILTAVETYRYPSGFAQYARAGCRRQIRDDLDALKFLTK